MAKKQIPDPSVIDITNINNLEAAKKTDKTFKKIIEEKPLSKKGKFNFRRSELVPLPSRGILYQNVTDAEEIFKGFIKLYPMTLKEEEILSTPRFLKSGSATRMILENCIDSNIDAKDILLFDSNFLMFYLRQISYGDEYTFSLKCMNNICEQKFEHTINISELKFEELPEDIKEPIIIKLPNCGYTVECILPRLYHSEDIYMRNKNKKKNTSDEDRRALDNLVTTTIKITDLEDNEVPKRYWEEFYQAVIGNDAAELRKKTKFNTGVDKLEDISCPYCGEDYSGTIPIGIEFFRF